MSSIPPNPLHDLQEKADAEFQAYADVQIVSTFGEPQAEYSAIHKGCALVDLPQRGLLEVTGHGRLEFLNRFLTNELINKQTSLPIPAGRGIYAFLLNNKGRIVADMNVLERGDRTLLETDARHIPQLKILLEKYVFSEKVSFASLAATHHQIALHGPRALDVLHKLIGEFPPLDPLGSVVTRIFEAEAVVWRDDPCGVPGHFLILPIEFAASTWSSLLAAFSSPAPDQLQQSRRQVWPAGWAAFNSARIEAGRPLFGIDFDDTVLPAETGQLPRAVSFTKGCYLGQEIVARMHARGQWAREIVGIKMEGDALPIAGAPIADAQNNTIGAVTSSTMSPILSNAAIAMAMLKKQFSAVGTVLSIAAEGAFRKGVVVELPFIPRQ